MIANHWAGTRSSDKASDIGHLPGEVWAHNNRYLDREAKVNMSKASPGFARAASFASSRKPNESPMVYFNRLLSEGTEPELAARRTGHGAKTGETRRDHAERLISEGMNVTNAISVARIPLAALHQPGESRWDFFIRLYTSMGVGLSDAAAATGLNIS
ncbi:hypothetical protein [Paraburkholderia humisilvae]|uniref:hypothetical protein n=1 Tax=Paraburkholderia humisilvae TaxID=627669 RepID=UPI001C2E7A8E|nr:hypothetical protein [Paraburkholderia humisilvae]